MCNAMIWASGGAASLQTPPYSMTDGPSLGI